jgi:hypothetical protein
MDWKSASHLGHVVPIVRELWIIRPSISSEPRFKSSRSLHSFFPEDTRHFPIREWLCSWPGFKTRRILSSVLHEWKSPILRGNRTVVRCKLHILRYRRLYGGGNRERTILHRRIPFNNPNLGPTWSVLVKRPEGAMSPSAIWLSLRLLQKINGVNGVCRYLCCFLCLTRA